MYSEFITLKSKTVQRLNKRRKRLTETVAIVIKASVDLEKEKQDFQSTLDVLEKDGLIGRTPNGKIYMTKKFLKEQTKIEELR